MANKQHFMPKSSKVENFGSGPWEDECDRFLWKTANFDCLVKRNMNLGHWCGYVGVLPPHPWYESEPDNVEVHGGVTYYQMCDGDALRGVCHIPDSEESGEVRWIGFDFAHGDDIVPGGLNRHNGHYWTFNEVCEEVESVARQAAKILDTI